MTSSIFFPNKYILSRTLFFSQVQFSMKLTFQQAHILAWQILFPYHVK